MASPNSAINGGIVSTTGAYVEDGLTATRARPIVEDGVGQFTIDVAPDGYDEVGIPNTDYLYVGNADDQYNNTEYPVFYEPSSDSYYVAGVDNIKYYLFGVSSYAGNGNGVYTTSYENFSTLNVDTSTKTFDYTVACYCSGSLIQTDMGDVPVERLAAGDTVVTASRRHRRVRWVGHRSYAGRFLAANPGVQPIRFHAGSLGPGLPRRDLLVSPEHAMFLDGVLVPARLLVNGVTVVQERGRTQVDYFHVELDSHDLLLAEGAASESFADDGHRGVFHNAAEWARTHPGRTRAPTRFCAPRVESGPDLEAIRRRLAGWMMLAKTKA